MLQSSKPINLEQNLWTTRVLLPCISVIVAILGSLRLTIDHALFGGYEIGVAEELLAFLLLGVSCLALTRLLAGPPLLLSVEGEQLVLSHAKTGRRLSRYSLDGLCAQTGYFKTLTGKRGGRLTVLRLRIGGRSLLVSPKGDDRYRYSWHHDRQGPHFSKNFAAPTHFVSDSEFRRLIRPLGLDPAFLVRPATAR